MAIENRQKTSSSSSGIYHEKHTLAEPRNVVKKKVLVRYRSKLPKIIFWIVIIGLIIYSYPFLKAQALNLLQMNETVWNIYLYFADEIESKSLLGLFYASFFGALFFLTIPSELIFLYYLGLDYYLLHIIGIVMIGNLLGMMINYAIGLWTGQGLIKYLLKENYDKYTRKVDRIGTWLIILGNILPFPIEIISVFLGGIRYNFLKFVIYTTIGKFLKFILLYIGYKYFMEIVQPILIDYFFPWTSSLIDNYVVPYLPYIFA